MEKEKQMKRNWGLIPEVVGKPAAYEQLAEEATELAQAALKYARILRNENPTPMTEKEAYGNIVEEYADVFLCAASLRLPIDMKIVNNKFDRFCKRCGCKQ